jgi:hypothetical protein
VVLVSHTELDGRTTATEETHDGGLSLLRDDERRRDGSERAGGAAVDEQVIVAHVDAHRHVALHVPRLEEQEHDEARPWKELNETEKDETHASSRFGEAHAEARGAREEDRGEHEEERAEPDDGDPLERRLQIHGRRLKTRATSVPEV